MTHLRHAPTSARKGGRLERGHARPLSERSHNRSRRSTRFSRSNRLRRLNGAKWFNCLHASNSKPKAQKAPTETISVQDRRQRLHQWPLRIMTVVTQRAVMALLEPREIALTRTGDLVT